MMLSIIIATYNSPETLDRAIGSVLSQTVPDWEIIISPDDGKDYSYLLKRDPRITLVKSDSIASGPGPARNRALSYVQGNAIASLDDDDELSETYVEMALTALAKESAIVFPTRYTGIRVIGQDIDRLSIERFSLELGSLHVVARRDCFPEWPNCFAEDVIHTCQVITQQGGSVPVIRDAEYILHVRDDSMCATYKDINADYDRIIQSMADPKIIELFKFRKHINTLYEDSNQNKTYQEFVKRLAI